MCSLSGQHEDILYMPKRRHIAGGMTEAVAATPRKVLTERRGAKHAQLEAELAPDAAPENEYAECEQMEMLPPGADQLPDHLINREPERDPRQWWVDRD